MKYVLVIVALCACDRQLNPEYCLAHPDDVRCGLLVDAPPPCTEDLDCPDQVCDTSARPPVCVDCTTTNATLCAATTPVCSADNDCRACATDDECAAGVCLPDGTCPTADSILFAAINGSTMNTCGSAADPCTIGQAVAQVDATRTIIKMVPNAGQDYIVAGGLLLNKNVTIIARGATFGRTGSGAMITVTAGRTVTIVGGVIKGGLGATTGHGILCTMMSVLTVIDADIGPNEGDGINDVGCGTFLSRVVIHNNDAGIEKVGGVLELSRSTIQNNPDGGIDLSGSGTRFTIVNNSFWMNGITGGPAGAISIDTDTPTTSRLDFNSFNANIAALGLGSAVHCILPGFTARNNVMFGNGDQFNAEQVGGNCSHTYSIVSPGTLPVGVGNKADDPMFVSATGDLRTLPGSPTEGAGDPASDLTGAAAIDVDAEPRTSPPDIGIDEHP